MSDPILKRADRIKEKPWHKVYDDFSQDTSISIDLRGLILYCISLPDDWEFHASHLAKVNNITIKRCYALIQEGINAGYIAKEFIKIGNLNNGVSYRFSDDKAEIKNISPTQSKSALSEEQFEKPEVQRENAYFSNISFDTAIFDASKNDTLRKNTYENRYKLRNVPKKEQNLSDELVEKFKAMGGSVGVTKIPKAKREVPSLLKIPELNDRDRQVLANQFADNLLELALDDARNYAKDGGNILNAAAFLTERCKHYKNKGTK